MSADPFVATLHQWIEVTMRHSMRNFLRYARESGLSMSHLGAIFHIHRAGSCGVTEIGDYLGVTSAAASQMLDRLVEQGLVARTEDPEDRRVKRIELTAEGERALEAGIQARETWMSELAGILAEDEKRTITSALQLMIAKVRQLDESTITAHS
ncbi:MAG: MarR family transcriptional regulator [Anaerolineales bacterium]|jgi:DNA-binding MarR family transcriptional regulator